MKSGSHSRTTAAHKTQIKFQAWSSLVFHCCHSSFNPSEAPPWDSRPVSGAGVVHYQILHRPRSVPTALGPAPLVTFMMKSFCCYSSITYRLLFFCQIVNRHPPFGNQIKEAVSKLPKYEVTLEQVTFYKCIFSFMLDNLLFSIQK